MFETCFEDLCSPGLYMSPCAVLSAFSAGRPTALVVDIGAAGIRISPVVDGFELKKSAVYTHRGGDALDQKLHDVLSSMSNSQLYSNNSLLCPWYESAKSKFKRTEDILLSGGGGGAGGGASGGGSGDEYNTVKTHQTTESFRQMHIYDVVRDVKHWMCFLPYEPIPEVHRTQFFNDQCKLLESYEMPSGAVVGASEGLCSIPDLVWFPSSSTDQTNSGNNNDNKNNNGSSNSGNGNSSASSSSSNSATSTNNTSENNNYGTDTNSNNNDVQNSHEESDSGIPRKRPRSDYTDSELLSNNHTTTSINGNITTTQHNNIENNIGNNSGIKELSECDTLSLSQLIYNVVGSVDVDARKELLANVLLVGGGALMTGIIPRLTHELNLFVPSHIKVTKCLRNVEFR